MKDSRDPSRQNLDHGSNLRRPPTSLQPSPHGGSSSERVDPGREEERRYEQYMRERTNIQVLYPDGAFLGTNNSVVNLTPAEMQQIREKKDREEEKRKREAWEALEREKQLEEEKIILDKKDHARAQALYLQEMRREKDFELNRQRQLAYRDLYQDGTLEAYEKSLDHEHEILESNRHPSLSTSTSLSSSDHGNIVLTDLPSINVLTSDEYIFQIISSSRIQGIMEAFDSSLRNILSQASSAQRSCSLIRRSLMLVSKFCGNIVDKGIDRKVWRIKCCNKTIVETIKQLDGSFSLFTSFGCEFFSMDGVDYVGMYPEQILYDSNALAFFCLLDAIRTYLHAFIDFIPDDLQTSFPMSIFDDYGPLSHRYKIVDSEEKDHCDWSPKLEPEPLSSDMDTIRVIFRTLGGNTLRRLFRRDSSIDQMFLYLESMRGSKAIVVPPSFDIIWKDMSGCSRDVLTKSLSELRCRTIRDLELPSEIALLIVDV